MGFTLSYSSISFHNANPESLFGGSSKYEIINNRLSIKATNTKEPVQTKIPKNNDNPDEKTNHPIHSTCEIDDKPFKAYRLNKSKVRKRCYALSRLEKSKKFLAFYTITYPEGLKDEDCYKLFNIWLTRCRRDAKLNTYLWVAERQKNSTIHFHMLTNDFMPINVVNTYMGKALTNLKRKGHEKLTRVETEKYNGVDVKKVGKKRKTLVGYLTKYITKNDIEFYRLPWHCSRDVSKLFTSQHISESQEEEYLSKLPAEEDKYIYHISDFCRVAAFKFIPDDDVFKVLDVANELIYQVENGDFEMRYLLGNPHYPENNEDGYIDLFE